MRHSRSPDQGAFDFEEVVGEIPPYRLQLLRDVGSVASVLAEKGRITESVADDVTQRTKVWTFGNRTPDDDDPIAA